MMPVPDPRVGSAALAGKVAHSFNALKGREAQQFLSERRMRQMAYTKDGREAELEQVSDSSELTMSDRRNLDDAVLEMIGVKTQQQRDALVDHLYAHLAEFFEQARQKEEKAIGNKNKSKRKSSLSPNEIAAQIYAELKDKFGHLLHPYSAYIDLNKPFSTYDLPVDGLPERYEDMFAEGSVRFVKGRKQLAIITTKTPAQAELLAFIADHGVRGMVRVPLNPVDCHALRQRYEGVLEDRAQRIRSLIAERTADLDLQEEIFSGTNDFVLHGA